MALTRMDRDRIVDLFRQTVQAAGAGRAPSPAATELLERLVQHGADQMVAAGETTPEAVYRAQLTLAPIARDVLRDTSVVQDVRTRIESFGVENEDAVMLEVMAARFANFKWPWPFNLFNP